MFCFVALQNADKFSAFRMHRLLNQVPINNIISLSAFRMHRLKSEASRRHLGKRCRGRDRGQCKEREPAALRLGFRCTSTSKSLPAELAEVTSSGRSKSLNNLQSKCSCAGPGSLLFVMIPHHRVLAKRRLRDCMSTQIHSQSET